MVNIYVNETSKLGDACKMHDYAKFTPTLLITKHENVYSRPTVKKRNKC